MRALVAGLVLAIAACGPGTGAGANAPGLPPLSNEQIAEQIDPGELEDVQATLRPLPPQGGEAERIASARRTIDAMTARIQRRTISPTEEDAVQILVALSSMEKLTANAGPHRTTACAVLVDGYELLETALMPYVFQEQYAHLYGAVPALSDKTKANLALIKRRPQLVHRAAACVLRAGGNAMEVASALDAAASYYANAGDQARARELHERAMARRGAAANANDWQQLAKWRAAALAPAEAKEALARAKTEASRLTDHDRLIFDRGLPSAEKWIADSERATQLASSKERDDEIGYTLILERLRSAVSVKPAFESLAQKYPDDARPFVALARLRLTEGPFDPEILDDAEATFRKADKGARKDRAYWDFAMCMAAANLGRAMLKAGESREAVIARLREAWTALVNVARGGLAAYDPALVEVLVLVEEIISTSLQSDPEVSADDRLTKLLVDRTAAMEALATRYPQSPDAARALLMIGARQVSTDGDIEEGFRLLKRDIHEAAQQDPDLFAEQAGLVAGLALTQKRLADADEILARARKAAPNDAGVKASLDLVEADIALARWRLEDNDEQGARAGVLYEGAMDMLPSGDVPRAGANHAALLYARGGRSGVAERVGRAKDQRGKVDIVQLAALVLTSANGEADADTEKALQALIDDESNRREVRATASAWIARLAKQRGDHTLARAAAKSALERTESKVPLDRAVLFEGSMSAGVTYAPSSEHLHKIQLRVGADPWVLVAAAMSLADLRALAESNEPARSR